VSPTRQSDLAGVSLSGRLNALCFRPADLCALGARGVVWAQEKGKVMTEAKQGDTVKVHYTGALADGTVFDSSQGREPLQFEVGKGQVIPGFEQAVVGLEEGESTKVEIAPEQAYGERRDELVLTVQRSRLPEGMDPKVGEQLRMSQPNGQAVVVSVTGVTEESVTLDANHPLAGKELHFELELVEIV
jgi:peptidylprolyl isomerase